MALIKKFNLFRLLWTLFVTWYFFNFFRNFFNSLNQSQSTIPIFFSIVLVFWMAVEYYFGSPFFQSGLVTIPHSIRFSFSIFFYLLVIYSITDYVSLNKTQIPLSYPYLNILGILLFIIGTVFRWITLFEILKSSSNKIIKSGTFNLCRHPRYFATFLQSIAVPLIFNSYLGIFISVTLGLGLIYQQIKIEEKALYALYPKDYDTYKKYVPLFFPKFSNLKFLSSKKN